MSSVISSRWGIAAVCWVLCSACLAEEPVDRDSAAAVVNLVFNRLDCDLDGTVEPEEVDEHLGQLWHPIDVDRSRWLNAREYAMSHRSVSVEVGASLFDEADADADGKISVDEYQAHLKRMILRVDDDGDREVSRPDVGLKPWPKGDGRIGFGKRITVSK